MNYSLRIVRRRLRGSCSVVKFYDTERRSSGLQSGEHDTVFVRDSDFSKTGFEDNRMTRGEC